MSNDAYTPTEDQMVRAYVERLGPITPPTEFRRQEEARRAIAAIRAEAWDEGHKASGVMLPTLPPRYPPNPYRDTQRIPNYYEED